MPYSIDEELNKRNPITPSHMSMTDQFLYRLASLDSSVESGFRRLDDNLERLRKDMHDAEIRYNDKINEVDKHARENISRIDVELTNRAKEGRAHLDKYNNRVTEIETWQKVAVARVSVIMAVIVGLWTFIAPTIRNILGIANG